MFLDILLKNLIILVALVKKRITAGLTNTKTYVHLTFATIKTLVFT